MSAMEGKTKRKRTVSRLRYAVGVVVLGVVGLIFASFALGHVGNYEVISNSMAPTLLKGNRVLVDQRPHYVPAVGDVVVFDDPESAGNLLTKRVAATAGQTVEIADGYLLVDGHKWAPPEQSLSRVPDGRQMERVELRKDEIFVLGDSLGNSQDSVEFGPVAARSVKGKVWFIYWPPARVGRVR